jgi:hypothetical protein
MRTTSEKFDRLRALVHDDAFEARIALSMCSPLLESALREMRVEHLHASALFMRRALVRYLALALCRLLEAPNETGRTGITASIPSLLATAKDEGVLSEREVDSYRADFERMKKAAADGEYDLVRALRDLRNIQVAHTLIPWKDPTDDLWAHHLAGFATELFGLVVRLERDFTETTGITLPDLASSAGTFEANASRFWQVVASLEK